MQHLGVLVKEWRALLRAPSKAGQLQSHPELEWRMGMLTSNGFVPGVTASDFKMIATKLEEFHSASLKGNIGLPSGLGAILKAQECHMEDSIYADNVRVRQSKIVSMSPENKSISSMGSSERVKKTSVAHSDMRVLQRPYDTRFSLKIEQTLDNKQPAGQGALKFVRLQTRRSFWVENVMRIDLSVIKSSSIAAATTYEVEMELVAEGCALLSDGQVVSRLFEWMREMQTWLGALNHSETVDGPLLVLMPGKASLVPLPGSAPQPALCSDILFVPVTRDISRS